MFFLLLKFLSTLVKNQLTVNISIYIWDLHYILLIYMGVFMPTPRSLDYYAFLVRFEMAKSWFLQVWFFFFFKIAFVIWIPYISIWISVSSFQFLQKWHLGFWQEWHWIWRSMWELYPYKWWIFPFINKGYIFIY